MSNLNYSQITRKSFRVKITFSEALKLKKFIKIHKKLLNELYKERISYLDYNMESYDFSKDVPESNTKTPTTLTYALGSVTFSDIGSFDNWLRKFKYIVVETFKSADVQVTEVYVNGGEYVSDPNAWFTIPELS